MAASTLSLSSAYKTSVFSEIHSVPYIFFHLKSFLWKGPLTVKVRKKIIHQIFGYISFCTEICVHFFFHQRFLPRTLTTHRTAREGRGPSFTPIYHFHLSRTFRYLFATLHVRWDYHILLIASLVSTCTFRSSFRISLIDDLVQKMSQTQSLIVYLLCKLVFVRETP